MIQQLNFYEFFDVSTSKGKNVMDTTRQKKEREFTDKEIQEKVVGTDTELIPRQAEMEVSGDGFMCTWTLKRIK